MDSVIQDVIDLSEIPASNILSIIILATAVLLVYVVQSMRKDGTTGLTDAIQQLGNVLQHMQAHQNAFQTEFIKIVVSVQQIAEILKEIQEMQEDIERIQTETAQNAAAFVTVYDRLVNMEHLLKEIMQGKATLTAMYEKLIVIERLVEKMIGEKTNA